MSIEEEFQKAAEEVKKFKTRPTDDELLLFYGFYKQATVGDNNTNQPWAVQMEARAKWEAWNKNKGMDKETAMKKYIELYESVKGKYS